MSEPSKTTEPSMEDPNYRTELLQRAALMGLTVHPNAKNETIAAKITAALKEQKPAEEAGSDDKADAPDKAATVSEPVSEAAAPPTTPAPAAAGAVAPLSKKAKELHPAKRLQRVRITCNDPQKADQSGDVISVSNGVIGNIRFYFHFNKPWHVPQIVLDTIKESKLFLHSSRKDGREYITREVPRYNIEYLPALDEKQRERIAAKQAAALATED